MNKRNAISPHNVEYKAEFASDALIFVRASITALELQNSVRPFKLSRQITTSSNASSYPPPGNWEITKSTSETIVLSGSLVKRFTQGKGNRAIE